MFNSKLKEALAGMLSHVPSRQMLIDRFGFKETDTFYPVENATHALSTEGVITHLINSEGWEDAHVISFEEKCGCKFTVITIEKSHFYGRLHDMAVIGLRLAANPMFDVSSIGYQMVAATAADHLAWTLSHDDHAAADEGIAVKIGEAIGDLVDSMTARHNAEEDEKEGKKEGDKSAILRTALSKMSPATRAKLGNLGEAEDNLVKAAEEAIAKYGFLSDEAKIAEILHNKIDKMREAESAGLFAITPYPVPDNSPEETPIDGKFVIGLTNKVDDGFVVVVVDDLTAASRALDRIEKEAFDKDIEYGRAMTRAMGPTAIVIREIVSRKPTTLKEFKEASEIGAKNALTMMLPRQGEIIN